MKNPAALLGLAWIVVLVSGCAATGPSQTGGSSSALQEVEAVERARFKAWIAADTAAMQPMLGDDLVYCHSTGQCMTKQEIVATIGSHETIYHAMDIVDLKLRQVAGAVVINGKLSIRAESGGKVTEFQGIYTDVYAKRNGRWQMVSWQSTRLP